LRKPPLLGNHQAVDGTGKIHLSGTSTLIRAYVHRALELRALSLRACVTFFALAGALALAGCYGDDGYQIPTRAMKELSPEMLALLDQKNMPKDSPVLVRVFKEESELEVWKQDTTGRYALLKIYPICRWSGELGPKKIQGDRQAPEGFYSITPGLMNPNSNYYLAINVGFPNAFDKANNYTGAFLMIHGDCSSAGCYAMTDEQIGEIYSLAREAFLGGQKEFQIQAYPFRLTAANLARHRTNPNMPFWKMLKEGSDHFEVTHLEPKVDVCERHYVFDAQPPENSTKALVFTPTGRCPAYEVPQDIAGPAMEKQRNDDYQLAQLTRENVAGRDGHRRRHEPGVRRQARYHRAVLRQRRPSARAAGSSRHADADHQHARGSRSLVDRQFGQFGTRLPCDVQVEQRAGVDAAGGPAAATAANAGRLGRRQRSRGLLQQLVQAEDRHRAATAASARHATCRPETRSGAAQA
jgi:murein L,D-transpeptidase YafK